MQVTEILIAVKDWQAALTAIEGYARHGQPIVAAAALKTISRGTHNLATRIERHLGVTLPANRSARKS